MVCNALANRGTLNGHGKVIFVEFIGKERENLFGIYGIRNKKNFKIYVGQTRESFKRRYLHHRSCLRSGTHCNQHLQNAFNAYGEDCFEFVIIQAIDDPNLLDSLEIYYIGIYSKDDMSYNISEGGAGKSHQMSEEAKRKVGEKNRMHMLGRKASEETKRKMRESSHHTKPTDEHKKILSEYMKNRIVKESTRKKISDMYSGEKSPFAKITDNDAAYIKEKLMSGMKMKDIANSLNVKIGIVESIASGKTFKNVYVDGWDQYLEIRKDKNRKSVHKEILCPAN